MLGSLINGIDQHAWLAVRSPVLIGGAYGSGSGRIIVLPLRLLMPVAALQFVGGVLFLDARLRNATDGLFSDHLLIGVGLVTYLAVTELGKRRARAERTLGSRSAL